MADKFTFSSAGEIQMIEFALARNGYTHELVSTLAAGDQLGGIREVLLGNAKIVPMQDPQVPFVAQPQPAPLPMSIIVDCDANPKIPSGLYLTGEGTEHRKMGKITLEKREDGKLYANGKEVVRHLSPNQTNGKAIQGHKLRKELKDVQVLNACIMDALLANPQLIPDEWKSGYTYFWGTTFRSVSGGLCVECLYWSGGQWDWSYSWLDYDWGSRYPAAVLAS